MEYSSAYWDKNDLPRNGQKDIKKNEIKPWRSQEWCIPSGEECEFVAAMEDILDVYTRKYDKNCILICMDESPKQLIEET